MMQSHNYDELAAQAEAGELRSIPGTIRRGADAVDAARATLLAATGTSSIEDATNVALGRPRVGEERSTTTIWKVRAPKQLDAAAASFVAHHEGMNLSLLVRKAVAEYVKNHDTVA